MQTEYSKPEETTSVV